MNKIDNQRYSSLLTLPNKSISILMSSALSPRQSHGAVALVRK
jgi:hypothetical protein